MYICVWSVCEDWCFTNRHATVTPSSSSASSSCPCCRLNWAAHKNAMHVHVSHEEGQRSDNAMTRVNATATIMAWTVIAVRVSELRYGATASVCICVYVCEEGSPHRTRFETTKRAFAQTLHLNWSYECTVWQHEYAYFILIYGRAGLRTH